MNTLISNERKQHEQDRILRVAQNQTDLLLEWATGVGKSRAALQIMKKLLEGGDDQNWYIVVSEVPHINNWKQEVRALGMKEYLGNGRITIFCYASLHKYEDFIGNLILDEVHHAFSDLRFEYLQSIKARRVIALSATLNRQQEILLLLWRPDMMKDELDMTNSIQKGILNDPEIRLSYTMLDDFTQSHTHEQRKGQHKPGEYEETIDFRDRWPKLKALKASGVPEYKLTIRCTENEKYKMLSENIKYWAGRSEAWASNLAKQLGSERKRLVAFSKNEKLLEDIEKHDNERKVIFTGSTQQAAWIDSMTSQNYRIVNSNNSKKQNEDIIQLFNTGQIDNLICVKMLREGMNLSNIHVGFIAQLDNQELSFIQMLGRCFRSEHPLMYVYVVKSTQDEIYYKTARKGIDEKYIKRIHG